jgi:hypothetical protein
VDHTTLTGDAALSIVSFSWDQRSFSKLGAPFGISCVNVGSRSISQSLAILKINAEELLATTDDGAFIK